jgi:hypothetical protein
MSQPVPSGFRRSLDAGGNEHPRFPTLDKFEQSLILVGCPITSASLSTSHRFFSPSFKPRQMFSLLETFDLAERASVMA